jgi:hypothetical protein
MKHQRPVSESVSAGRMMLDELGVVPPGGGTILSFILRYSRVIFLVSVSFLGCLVGFMGQLSRSGTFFFARSSDLCFGLVGRRLTLPHHEDFSATVRIKLQRRIVDWICCIRQQILWWSMLSPEESDSDFTDLLDLYLSRASHARPTRTRVGGNRSVSDLATSRDLGSCKLISPILSTMKSRDLKINLESGRKLLVDLNTTI